ncbi:adenylate/guanylate cyclase domain-containing protein [Streptomyces sp. NPDC096354]|uniref:adenylate/guanylate cyclase domain-containing protein n=1 Tax=Streptomyces sp. NPDC096354 TaxID=3366088 RepID=UPI00380489A5
MSTAGPRCGSCGTQVEPTGRFCSTCGTAVSPFASSSESRRIVTVLFVDLVGSTPLAESIDPEALRTAMDSFYHVCTAAIEAKEGVAEKFIGDAVMAVFGAYDSSEDGATRAVEAALTIRSSMDELNVRLEENIGVRLDIRCGVHSGEAVVVQSAGLREPRVIGDVVNTAARLQSAASVNEILVGESTAHLVGARLRVEAARSVMLKGKREPVPTQSVVGLSEESPARDLAPMIGRETEGTQLNDAFIRSQRTNRAQLVVVSGPPGIGKSRIVREFIERRATNGHVLQAVCPTYGRGLTYQPLADLVRCLSDGWNTVVRLLQAEEAAGDRAINALATALDMQPGQEHISGVADITWAVRCLMTALARQGPLIVVLEDLHHAEPTLLDLIHAVVGGIDAAVTVVCTTRPDLYLAAPGWGTDLRHSVRLELSGLSGPYIERLLHDLSIRAEPHVRLPGAAVSRIVQRCEGNPLYAELLFAASGAGDAQAGLPSTLRVLLESWLDRLPAHDREVLRRAATMGSTFSRAQLMAVDADSTMSTADLEVNSCLNRLVSAGTIQRVGGDDHYRFSQSLVQETLYEMTAKGLRARWHLSEAERITRHAQQPATTSPGVDGALARHLEAAYLLRKEVQPGDLQLPGLAARAADALIRTGTRALRRKDLPASISLLERGRELVPSGEPVHRVLALRIFDACTGLAEWPRAESALAHAEALLPADERTVRLVAVLRSTLRVRAEAPVQPAEDIAALVHGDVDDHFSWCRYLHLIALREFAAGRLSQAEASLRAALDRTRHLDPDVASHEAARLEAAICELTQWSPTHVRESIALCTNVASRVDSDRTLLIPILLARSRLQAMADDVVGARATLAETRVHIDQLQLALGAPAVEQAAGFVEGLAGEHKKAQEHYEEAARHLSVLGLNREATASRLYCAREMLRSGNHVAASSLLDTARESRLDSRCRVLWWALKTRLSAMTSDASGTTEGVASTIAALGPVDDPLLIGDAWSDLALALWDVGQEKDAHRAAGNAESSYRQKGASLPARQVRRWIIATGGVPR